MHAIKDHRPMSDKTYTVHLSKSRNSVDEGNTLYQANVPITVPIRASSMWQAREQAKATYPTRKVVAVVEVGTATRK